MEELKKDVNSVWKKRERVNNGVNVNIIITQEKNTLNNVFFLFYVYNSDYE